MHFRDFNPHKQKKLVLLHGNVFDGRLWDPAVPSFDAHVIVPDLPGYGLSAGEAEFDFLKQEESLEAAILARTSGPVHLVGYSFGSYHLLAVALRGKVNVASLTMLGPLAGEPVAALQARTALVPAVRSGQINWVDVFMTILFTPEYAAANPATVAATKALTSTMAIRTLLEETSQLPGLVDLRPRLKDLNVPLLVRVGDKDPSTPAAYGEEIKKLAPKVTLEVVPNTAHHYLGTDFEGTVASIKRFTGC